MAVISYFMCPMWYGCYVVASKQVTQMDCVTDLRLHRGLQRCHVLQRAPQDGVTPPPAALTNSRKNLLHGPCVRFVPGHEGDRKNKSSPTTGEDGRGCLTTLEFPQKFCWLAKLLQMETGSRLSWSQTKNWTGHTDIVKQSKREIY